MKKIIYVLLAVLILASSLLIVSCDKGGDDKNNQGDFEIKGSNGLAYTLSKDLKYYIVTGIGSCTDKNIVIPAMYQGKPVRAIAEGAFAVSDSSAALAKSVRKAKKVNLAPSDYDNFEDETLAKIESVEIADTVLEIGDSAFEGCESLEKIEVSDLITMIGTDAFKDTAFYLDEDNWTDGVLYLENYLVEAKKDVTSVTVREGTLNIADNAFYECKYLVSIDFGKDIQIIGKKAFYGCYELKSVNLGVSGIYIGESAFEHCIELESVVVGNDVLPTELSAEDKEALNCISTSEDAEANGVNGSSITIKLASMTHLVGEDDSNFVYASCISKNAFYGCISLTGITIGANVKSIGMSAFGKCTALTDVSLASMIATRELTEPFIHRDGYTCEITSLSSVFEGCTSLVNVTLPQNIRNINGTFKNCTALESFVVPEGIINIRHAFEGCTSLSSVELPDGVKYIGSAFRDCSSLTMINLPESVTKIEADTFLRCESLAELNLHDYVSVIAAQAFEGIVQGAILRFGTSVVKIEENAFDSSMVIYYYGTPEAWELVEIGGEIEAEVIFMD